MPTLPNPQLPNLSAAKIPHTILAAAIAYVAVPLLFALLYELRPAGTHMGFAFVSQFSFLVSWIGFALLLIAFAILSKLKSNGLLLTTLAGGLLGPFAYTLYEWINQNHLSSWLEDGFLVMMTSLGALHAAAFWITLRALLWLHLRIARSFAKLPQS